MDYNSFFKKMIGPLDHAQATTVYNECEFLALFNALKKKGIITDKEFRSELSLLLDKYAKEIEKSQFK